jgi:Skp family chaperone for outer membrane proteins
MKKNLLKALALASIFGADVAASNQKIAVADMTNLIQTSDFAADVAKLAEAKQKDLQKLAQEFGKELEKTTKSLGDRFRSEDLGSMAEAFAKNEQIAEQKFAEAKFDRERLSANLEVEKAGIDCKNKVKDLVAAYAKQNGLDAVLDSRADGVVFVKPDLDITAELRNFVAAAYKNDKRRSSLLASVTTDKKEAALLATADMAKETPTKA